MKPNEVLFTLHCFAHVFSKVDAEKTWAKVWEVGTKFNVPKENLGYIHQQLEGKIYFQNVPVPQSLTPNQRIAIAANVHLFAAALGFNDTNLQILSEIRDSLNISHFFGSFVLERVSRDGVQRLITANPFDSFFNPPDEIAKFIVQVTRMALNEGHGIKKRRVPDLMPQEYEHPFDRKALNSLAGTPGLEYLTRKVWEHGLERIFRTRYTGSFVKASPKSFPQLHHALLEGCQILGISQVPELYIKIGFVNAMTIGTEKPVIVLDMGTCSLSYDELIFIIGHELGHIKSEHVLYHFMAEVVPIIGGIIGTATLGIGEAVFAGLQIALLYWKRQSEFTADRAGLLTCQNIEAGIKCMMKIAGYPPRFYQQIDPTHFLAQAQEFDAYDEEKMNKIAKAFSVMTMDHPWTVMRCAEMKRWYDSGEYFMILNRKSSPMLPP